MTEHDDSILHKLNLDATRERLARVTCEGEVPLNFVDIICEYNIQGYTLDVGCGVGFILRRLGPNSVGIDFVKENCIECHRKGLTSVLADANGGLPFRSGSFEASICSHTLEHLKSPLSLLVEIRRILKPGGIVILCLPTYGSIVRILHDDYFDDHASHLYALDPAGIERLLQVAGLSLLEMRIDLPRSHRSRVMRVIQEVSNRLPRCMLRASNSYWIVAVKLECP